MKKTMTMVVILAFLATIGCIDLTESDAETAVSITNVCKFDWTYKKVGHLGAEPGLWGARVDQRTATYYRASNGYTYAIVSIYLKNEGDDVISTNPSDWRMVVNGVQYDPSILTYSEHVNHHTVNILPNGEFTTEILYEVLDGANLTCSMVYIGQSSCEFEKIDYFNLTLQETRYRTVGGA